MSAESESHHFRGVHCRRCGKPVRLPELVTKRDAAVHAPEQSTDTEFHLASKVFVLRCHSCRRESIYAINQIVDCGQVLSAVS